MSDTVVDENTGEVVPVQQVKAVAALSAVAGVGSRSEWPEEAAKHIEQAMVAAAQNAIAEFGHDADKIRAAMLSARNGVKTAMRNFMHDHWSQIEAAARDTEQNKEK